MPDCSNTPPAADFVVETLTPALLERLGLALSTALLNDPARPLSGPPNAERQRPHTSLFGAEIPSHPALQAPQALLNAGVDTPATFRSPNDVILLLQPVDLGRANVQPALDDLLLRLAAKRFLRSAAALASEGLAATLTAASHDLGCRIDLTALEEGISPQAVLLTCGPRAHLALANVAERTGRFTATAIGRVTGAGNAPPASRA